MKRQQVVSDYQLILSTQGLRFVQKSYHHSYTGADYFIEWEFKGSKGSAGYIIEAERDAMFDKIVAAMVNIDKKESTDGS